MSLIDDLQSAFLDGYQRAGEEVGYWGHRFRQSVLKNGALATAKHMLKPRNEQQRAGLDALLNAGRPDLTVEAIILEPRFARLFTRDELQVAKNRLGRFRKAAKQIEQERDYLFPDELPVGKKYPAGAKKQVRVNAYERNPRARTACLRHYGYRCSVCNLLFEEAYGKRGQNFIHVHHLQPVARLPEGYELDPIKDLTPVCPNCHAMLHRGKDVLSIDDLRQQLRGTLANPRLEQPGA